MDAGGHVPGAGGNVLTGGTATNGPTGAVSGNREEKSDAVEVFQIGGPKPKKPDAKKKKR